VTVVVAAVAVVGVSVISPVVAQQPVAATHPAATGKAKRATAAAVGTTWTAAWRAAAQQPQASGVSSAGFANQTVRMVIHPDVTGNSVRIRLSNAYGTQPVTIGSVSVARRTAGPDFAAGSRRTVTFGLQGSVTIPAGQEVVSDPVKLAVQRDQDLVVSLFFPVATGPTTWHFEAEATTSISQPGDWTARPGGSPYQTITPSWFYLDGVDVRGPALDGTVVAFGDSITDGHYSTIDGNGRWPDWLALRVPNFTVINEGIGGNRILTDTSSSGVSALNRLDRDMIDQLGVTDVIFLEGINDIDNDATAE
jgi:hypothetical protein